MTQATYDKEKHQRSDRWLHSPALARHVRQAYAHRLNAFDLLDSQLNLSTTTFDHDAHYCVDCEFTACNDKDKEICLTGRAAFRCRTPKTLREYGQDVTISKRFVQDGRPAEFYKTRATTMIYAHESWDEKPGNGFPLIVIFNLSQTIQLLEMGALPAVVNSKKNSRSKKPYEEFYGVNICDLYEHNLLTYVGVCPTQRANSNVSDRIRAIFANKMPAIYKALESSKSYWSAYIQK